MTTIAEIETVKSIMNRFRVKRLKWMKDHNSDECPASLSRESEALAIIGYIRNSNDDTDQFIGHH